MFDLDQASRLGVSMWLGDLRVYGSDGNRSAFEAMVEAGQQIQAMGLHVLNSALMVGSFVPGPIGILSNGISMMMALANGDEGTALEMGIGMVARMNPCGRAFLLRRTIQFAKVVDIKINLERAHAAWQQGDYLTAGTSLLGAVSSAATLRKACFAAGTKLLTKRGWLPIEQLQVGDEVWSKPEGEPGHPGDWKMVEELFQRTGRIWHLHAGGELIRTTGEHPFYVVGKGWTDACFLQAGDLLCSRDGRTVAVEEAYDTGEYERVYNCRVAEWHTYFVGDEGWAFDVWTHNAACDNWSTFRTATRGLYRGLTAPMRAAGSLWTAIRTQRATPGAHTHGTTKPPTTGAAPNSMYTHVNSSGRAVQTAIYDANGNVIAHIDFKNHGSSALSGHGHLFPTPGNPASGHGAGKPHVPNTDLPAEWLRLPGGVLPYTPIGS
jgi:hypothetical protein